MLAGLGAAAMALGIFGALTPGEAWVGAGAVGVFLGVALLSPLLVTPVASVVGAPLERLGGVPGTLARENSVRNPGRTASTAAALMIGLALVSFVAVFAAGIKGSIDDAIDKTLIGDLTISNDDGFSDIPIAVRDEVAAIDGVETASALRFTEDEVDGEAGHADPDRPGDRGPGAAARLGGGLGRAAHRPRCGRGGDRRAVRRRQSGSRSAPASRRRRSAATP